MCVHFTFRLEENTIDGSRSAIQSLSDSAGISNTPFFEDSGGMLNYCTCDNLVGLFQSPCQKSAQRFPHFSIKTFINKHSRHEETSRVSISVLNCRIGIGLGSKHKNSVPSFSSTGKTRFRVM